MAFPGLPRRRLDQQRQPMSPAVTPGGAAGKFIGRLVVIQGTGPNTGFFVYNGAAAAGNPPIVAIVAPGVTKDPYGNTVSALMNIGNLAGAHVGWDVNAVQYLADSTGTPRIVFDPGKRLIEFFGAGGPGTAPLITLSPQAGTDSFGEAFLVGITTINTGSGDYCEIDQNVIALGNALFTTSGFIKVQSSTSGVLQFISPQRSIADSVCQLSLIPSTTAQQTAAVDRIQAWDPAGPGATVETWHSLGTLAGYTVTRGRYKMTAEGQVEFDISVTGGGANAAAVNWSTTLAAPYVPTAFYQLPMTTALASPANLPRLSITNAGVVTVAFVANTTAAVTGTALMPLD